MSNLMRWEPFRESRKLHDLLDRFMDRSYGEASWFDVGLMDRLPLDVYTTDDAWIVKANVPGFKPEEIEISVTGDTLAIQGETKQELESNGDEGKYLVRERRVSNFARSLTLPGKLEAEQAKAEFENGVLTLTLPKPEQIKPKRISVKSKLAQRGPNPTSA